MKAAVVTFPGSNCDRDLAVALGKVTSEPVLRVWHGEEDFPDVDLIAVPGGFSYGDYLRCGAMAARSPVMAEVARRAEAGVLVLGVCNGFQVLTELGLLPGALIRNAGLRFVCRPVELEVAGRDSPFTAGYDDRDGTIRLPVAHHDGNFVADAATLDALEAEGRVAFRYRDNPNGSARGIAGVVNARGNVLGLMPHPERAADPRLGSTDGAPLFAGLAAAFP